MATVEFKDLVKRYDAIEVQHGVGQRRGLTGASPKLD